MFVVLAIRGISVQNSSQVEVRQSNYRKKTAAVSHLPTELVGTPDFHSKLPKKGVSEENIRGIPKNHPNSVDHRNFGAILAASSFPLFPRP